MSITYEESVTDRKKVKQQDTRNTTTRYKSYIFAQLSKKDVIALHAEMQVIAEQVLAANGIVIEVATKDALLRAERWNADFEADHKAISDRVFEYIAPPVPNNSSPQLSTGSFTEEDDQESNHFSEIPQSPTRASRYVIGRTYVHRTSPIGRRSNRQTSQGNFVFPLLLP